MSCSCRSSSLSPAAPAAPMPTGWWLDSTRSCDTARAPRSPRSHVDSPHPDRRTAQTSQLLAHPAQERRGARRRADVGAWGVGIRAARDRIPRSVLGRSTPPAGRDPRDGRGLDAGGTGGRAAAGGLRAGSSGGTRATRGRERRRGAPRPRRRHANRARRGSGAVPEAQARADPSRAPRAANFVAVEDRYGYVVLAAGSLPPTSGGRAGCSARSSGWRTGAADSFGAWRSFRTRAPTSSCRGSTSATGSSTPS